jgi:hypothetical protein
LAAVRLVSEPRREAEQRAQRVQVGETPQRQVGER